MLRPSQTAAAAEEIKVLLVRQRKTKQALAEALGMHYQSLWRRLNGQTPISLDELGAIAQFFEVPVSALLPDADAAAPDEPPRFRRPVSSAA